ncbi:MAG: hypothetical protein AB7S38_33835 [Vulcanimicrobiota bacterium]
MLIQPTTPWRPMTARHQANSHSSPAQAEPSDRVQLTGLVPDYARGSAVVAHQLVRDLVPSLVGVLYDRLGSAFDLQSVGYQGPRSGYSDPNLVWMRDYHPLYRRDQNGDLSVVKFLSPNPYRQQYQTATYVPVAPPAPDQKFFPMPGHQGRWLPSETAKIQAQGGQLVPTGEFLLVSQGLLDENQTEQPSLSQFGYAPRQADQVLAELSTSSATSVEKILVMPGLPGDKTGHVDMYCQALAPREVLVLDDEPNRDFLEGQVARLAQAGLEVERLPSIRADGHLYSPTNAELVNVDGQRLCLLPVPSNPDATAQQTIQKWQDFYQSRGWQTQTVPADAAARANGLLRCLTYQVPI